MFLNLRYWQDDKISINDHTNARDASSGKSHEKQTHKGQRTNSIRKMNEFLKKQIKKSCIRGQFSIINYQKNFPNRCPLKSACPLSAAVSICICFTWVFPVNVSQMISMYATMVTRDGLVSWINSSQPGSWQVLRPIKVLKVVLQEKVEIWMIKNPKLTSVEGWRMAVCFTTSRFSWGTYVICGAGRSLVSTCDLEFKKLDSGHAVLGFLSLTAV